MGADYAGLCGMQAHSGVGHCHPAAFRPEFDPALTKVICPSGTVDWNADTFPAHVAPPAAIRLLPVHRIGMRLPWQLNPCIMHASGVNLIVISMACVCSGRRPKRDFECRCKQSGQPPRHDWSRRTASAGRPGVCRNGHATTLNVAVLSRPSDRCRGRAGRRYHCGSRCAPCRAEHPRDRGSGDAAHVRGCPVVVTGLARAGRPQRSCARYVDVCRPSQSARVILPHCSSGARPPFDPIPVASSCCWQ